MQQKFILIQGLTNYGKQFRPSDWAQRLCGLIADHSKAIVKYHPYAIPITHKGLSCLKLDYRCQHEFYDFWQQVSAFAHDNQLIVELFEEPTIASQPVESKIICIYKNWLDKLVCATVRQV